MLIVNKLQTNSQKLQIMLWKDFTITGTVYKLLDLMPTYSQLHRIIPHGDTLKS